MGMLIALAQAGLSLASCTANLCDGERLRPYFTALAAARWRGRPVRILQVGDSHTAGDQITGSWRTILQTRYGSAGRGVLAPGRPYAGYLTRGITAAQSTGWAVDGIFGPAWHGGDGAAKGIAQYSLTAMQDGAAMTLSADAGELFDRFTVCALARPGAGTLLLSAGATTATITLDRPAAPLCSTITAPGPAASASLSVAGGPVTITSWSTERAADGVILSNLGTVGAQLTHLSRTDDDVLAAELQTYRPDLLVIAFGTNEAFSPTFTAAGFEATLRAQVARLRRDLPDVPVLLLGAPDSGTKQPALQAGALPCSAWQYQVPAAAIPGATLQPLPAAANWSPTAPLPIVQAIQRRVAHDLGLAFWSWSDAMGGRCTANAWTAAVPPLMRGDHVHFTSAGGAEIARRLQADLDAAARER